MDLLMAEIARKRKSVEMAKASDKVRKISANVKSLNNSTSKKRQFLRAGDLRRFEERYEWSNRMKENVNNGRYRNEDSDLKDDCEDDSQPQPELERAKQKSIDSGRDSGRDSSESLKEHEKTKDDIKSSNEFPSSSYETNTVLSSLSSSENQISKLSPTEITQKLRSIGQPIRLFGEKTIQKGQKGQKGQKVQYEDTEREARLLLAQQSLQKALSGKSDMDEFRLGSGHGIRNPFLDKQSEKKDTNSNNAANGSADTMSMNDGTVVSNTSNTSNISKNSKTGRNEKDKEDDETAQDPHKHIHKFFKTLLKEWENDLLVRPESVKRTAAGKTETKTLKQCKDYIRPLFKLCKSRRLEPFLLNQIYKIVLHCQEGDFVKANNVYNDVAIGRAAWPIGVTMVGIHARSGRAKIESGNVAHVMNSELQRKYLTSVKRLMTYNQNKRVDVAPSKKVLN